MIRDLNDEINKRIREKRHWERRIVELGGPDYARSQPAQAYDADGVEVRGAGGGYKYFGAAKNLPGVRELFQRDEPEPRRRSRQDMHKHIEPDYYGFRDDEDAEQLAAEQQAEQRLLAQALEDWDEADAAKRRAVDVAGSSSGSQGSSAGVRCLTRCCAGEGDRDRSDACSVFLSMMRTGETRRRCQLTPDSCYDALKDPTGEVIHCIHLATTLSFPLRFSSRTAASTSLQLMHNHGDACELFFFYFEALAASGGGEHIARQVTAARTVNLRSRDEDPRPRRRYHRRNTNKQEAPAISSERRAASKPRTPLVDSNTETLGSLDARSSPLGSEVSRSLLDFKCVCWKGDRGLSAPRA